MEKKRECRIIEDLLPNYIEGLTNEVTNEFINEHLKGCIDCQKEKKKMTDKIEIKELLNEQKEIDYMKKYRKKMNVLKGIIAIIIIVETIFLGNLFSKFYIINKFKNKMAQGNPDNYYVKMIDNDTKSFSESWRNGNKGLRKVYKQDSTLHMIWADEEYAWIMLNIENKKVAIKLDKEKIRFGII